MGYKLILNILQMENNLIITITDYWYLLVFL